MIEQYRERQYTHMHTNRHIHIEGKRGKHRLRTQEWMASKGFPKYLFSVF